MATVTIILEDDDDRMKVSGEFDPPVLDGDPSEAQKAGHLAIDLVTRLRNGATISEIAEEWLQMDDSLLDEIMDEDTLWMEEHARDEQS